MNLQLAVTVLLLALGLLAVNARPRGQRVSSEVVGPIAVMFGGRGAHASLVYLEQVIARRNDMPRRSRRIYVRARADPQSVQPWWPVGQMWRLGQLLSA